MYNEDDNNIFDQPQQEDDKAHDAVKSRRSGKVIALALSGTILCGAVGFGGGLLGARLSDGGQNTTIIQEGNRETSKIELTSVDTSQQLSAAELYAVNVNSTVGIRTSVTTNLWGYQTTSAASGSGFILTADGYILTNYHVISDSSSITVTLYDETSYEASVVGFDESNDIAVLKIQAEGLTPVVLGDSDELNVGDAVVAIGNPLGELTFSLTSGTVSALDREITLNTGNTMELIQTDCAINSGNSGGALFNMYGEVIGITNAKYSSSSSGTTVDNIGFAIPVNNVRSIVESIIENGYFAKPYIGVTVSDVSSESIGYGLPQGAAIRAVAEGSPAESAGLMENDIVTAVNGSAITTKDELVDFIGNCQVGDTISLSVYRQGESFDIEMSIGEQIQTATETSSDTQDYSQRQQFLPGSSGSSYMQ